MGIGKICRAASISMMSGMLMWMASANAQIAPETVLSASCGPVPRCHNSIQDLQNGTALVYGSGQLSIWRRTDAGAWEVEADLLDPFAPEPRPYYNSYFGELAAIDGNVLAVAAEPEARTVVYIFMRRNGVWAYTQTIQVSDENDSIYLSQLKLKNGLLLMSQYGISDSTDQPAATVQVYEQRRDRSFTLRQTLAPVPEYTHPYRIDLDDTANHEWVVLAAGADEQRAGAVYVYERRERGHAPLKLRQTIQPEGLTVADEYAAGESFSGGALTGVALSGRTLAVSAPGVAAVAPTLYPGAIYMYELRRDGRWHYRERIVDPRTEPAYNDPSYDPNADLSTMLFGTVFALSGPRLLAKYRFYNTAGHAFLFERGVSKWSLTESIGNTDSQAGNLNVTQVLLDGRIALTQETWPEWSVTVYAYELPELSAPAATLETTE